MSIKGSTRKIRTLRVLCKSDEPCCFGGYRCSLARAEGFEYCARHILEDKKAPFVQCSYVYSSSSKQCFRAAPFSDRKDGYCLDHCREGMRKRQKGNFKQKPVDSPEFLLKQLSHHHVSPLLTLQNAIPDPANVPSIAASALQYSTPDEDDSNCLSELDVRLLPRVQDDSELDSAESDADPLEHAGVYTTEEASRIYIEKMKKLKGLYTGEFKRLYHILRENRREYLHALKIEKETLMSIHAQPKDTSKERDAYAELKSLARSHRHNSMEALLYKRSVERRAQAAEGVPVTKSSSTPGFVKCIYSEGSWRCGVKSIPLAKYCFKHIVQDERQVLFRACGSLQGGGEECEVPVIPLTHTPTCVYHTPVPEVLPVSDPPLEVVQQCPLSTHPKIIDLSDTSAFIISEMPPDNVMEGDTADNSIQKNNSHLSSSAAARKITQNPALSVT